MYNYECGSCDRTFPAGWQARDQHCNSTGHRRPAFECYTCARWFNSQKACDDHMNALNHFEFECGICDLTWPTKKGRTQHYINDHYHCKACKRTFQNYNNIKMHLNSRIHRGADMACPFCKGKFATATGVAHHVERGSCPQAAQINRDELYKFIRAKDPQGLISKKLIGWTGSSQYEASDRAWNGYAYECYLCHRDFSQLRGLNQHLNSPTHQQKLYHCPQPSCRQDFVSLAAIINHLESETCGFMRFETVQKRFGDIIDPNRRLAF